MCPDSRETHPCGEVDHVASAVRQAAATPNRASVASVASAEKSPHLALHRRAEGRKGKRDLGSFGRFGNGHASYADSSALGRDADAPRGKCTFGGVRGPWRPGAGNHARGVHIRRCARALAPRRRQPRAGSAFGGVRGPAWFLKSYPNWVRPYPNWVRLGELQNLDADADWPGREGNPQSVLRFGSRTRAAQSVPSKSSALPPFLCKTKLCKAK
jgi:hypothetical protein